MDQCLAQLPINTIPPTQFRVIMVLVKGRLAISVYVCTMWIQMLWLSDEFCFKKSSLSTLSWRLSKSLSRPQFITKRQQTKSTWSALCEAKKIDMVAMSLRWSFQRQLQRGKLPRSTAEAQLNLNVVFVHGQMVVYLPGERGRALGIVCVVTPAKASRRHRAGNISTCASLL